MFPSEHDGELWSCSGFGSDGQKLSRHKQAAAFHFSAYIVRRR